MRKGLLAFPAPTSPASTRSGYFLLHHCHWRRPIGDGRGRALGRGGGSGVATPPHYIHPRSSGGWREGCRLVWRAHCPAGREGGISSERDRRSRRGLRQDAVVYNEPGRRVTSLGGEQGDGGDPFTGGPAKRVPVKGRLCTQRLLYQTREAFVHASRRTERRLIWRGRGRVCPA